MNPVLRIATLWARHALWLALALLLSLAALAAGIALMGYSGRYLAASLFGIVLAVPLALQCTGLARVILRYLERITGHEAIFRALADLRVWMFRGLAASAAGGLGYRRAGDALARLVNDVDTLDGLFLRIFIPVLSALILVPVLGWFLWQEHGLALAVLAPFLIVAFYLPLRAAQEARATAAEAGLAMSGLRSIVLDTLHGLREVKIFEAEGRMLAAVQAREAAYLAAQRALVARTSSINAQSFLLAQAAILAAILLGFFGTPIPALIAVLILIAAFESVLALPRAGVLYGQSAAAAVRVVSAAEAAPPVPDPATPQPMPSRNAIAFEHVSFSYAPDRPPVFENLSLQLPQGSRTAILGPSGAGKSTIAALLLKLIAPSAGQIRLGGTDISLLPAEAVRHRIAYLGQTTHLFADTIRNNLLLGDPTADDARLWAALDAAQLADTINALPEGLNSWLGEAGATLSGGQGRRLALARTLLMDAPILLLDELWAALDAAQLADTINALPEGLNSWLGEAGATLSGGQGRRLALARTLLMDAPILLLDEPCAGLDAATEQEFFKVLNTAAEGRTMLLILHRLTGHENLDRIWRLTGGILISAAG